MVSDLKERIKRVIRRDRVKEKDVLVRIKNQWNDEKKIPLADYIFKNNSLMDNREKVIEMIKIINNKFK